MVHGYAWASLKIYIKTVGPLLDKLGQIQTIPITIFLNSQFYSENFFDNFDK